MNSVSKLIPCLRDDITTLVFGGVPVAFKSLVFHVDICILLLVFWSVLCLINCFHFILDLGQFECLFIKSVYVNEVIIMSSYMYIYIQYINLFPHFLVAGCFEKEKKKILRANLL